MPVYMSETLYMLVPFWRGCGSVEAASAHFRCLCCDRRTLLAGRLALPHPGALATFGDSVYASDWTKLNIVRFSQYTRQRNYSQLLTAAATAGGVVSGLAVVHPLGQAIGG